MSTSATRTFTPTPLDTASQRLIVRQRLFPPLLMTARDYACKVFTVSFSLPINAWDLRRSDFKEVRALLPAWLLRRSHNASLCSEYFLYNAACPLIPDYFGSNITRNCLLQCNRGEFADPKTRQCVQICPTGLYGDYSTRRCVQNCPKSQGTYADPLSNLCVAICAANYYADDSTRTCVQAMYCSNNTFGDPIMQLCVQPNGTSLSM